MINVYNFRKSYLLKVYSAKCKKGRFLGSMGLIDLVGVELATSLVKRAEKSKSDKITCRLRRGLRFTFYVK